MVRITDFTLSLVGIVIELSDGNPGAATTLMELAGSAAEVDPQNMLGGLGAVLMFDTYGIYGSDIYVLWNDQCLRDNRKMHLLMRATQLGIFDLNRLQTLAGDQDRTNLISDEEFADLDYQVCKRLPEFMSLADMAAYCKQLYAWLRQ